MTYPTGDLAAASVTLARRFAAGATMWCVSRTWPHHARHLAVEFVHPVIVGKRALPAVHLEGPDLTSALRLLSRPGDVVAALGAAGERDDIADLLRRAETWGLTRLWIGAGPAPAGPLVDHRIALVDDDPDRAVRAGDLILLYHVLWELTHVVFEHPGLLDEPPGPEPEVCVTCADDARLGEIREVHDDQSADAIIDGKVQLVEVSLLDRVQAGDLVLVHAGVAIAPAGEETPV